MAAREKRKLIEAAAWCLAKYERTRRPLQICNKHLQPTLRPRLFEQLAPQLSGSEQDRCDCSPTGTTAGVGAASRRATRC